MTRPGPARDDAYGLDRSLRESIHDRVRNDLTDSAARPGHLIRSMTAFLPAYAGVALLLPGSPALSPRTRCPAEWSPFGPAHCGKRIRSAPGLR